MLTASSSGVSARISVPIGEYTRRKSLSLNRRESGVHLVALAPAADHADIAGAGAQRPLEDGFIVQVAAGNDNDIAVFIHLQRRQIIETVQDDQFGGSGKTLATGIFGAVIEDNRFEADRLRQGSNFLRNVASAEDVGYAGGANRLHQEALPV